MGKKSRGRNSGFLVQGSILAMASVICRLIGVVYRFALTNVLGDLGNDYYGSAYAVYNMLLMISSYSLPLAVSKLVSERVEKGQRRNAYKLFRCALTFSFLAGTLAALVTLFGAQWITENLMKTPMSLYALQVLTPTLLVVAVMGVLRGYFQGLGTMMPTALSQVLEQLINAGVSVVAAYAFASQGRRIGAILGDKDVYAAAYGAAGGTLGTSAGAVVGFLFLGFVYLLYRGTFLRQMDKEKGRSRESTGHICTVMALTIIPVVISATVYNGGDILDQIIYKNALNHLGVDHRQISAWWGIYMGKYLVLTNVPIMIASAIGVSVIPGLSAAIGAGDKRQAKRQISLAVRFVMVVTIPCAVGLMVLASPILTLLFNDAGELPANMLRVGALSIVFYSLATLTNAVLQGINRMAAPIRNALIALVIHVVPLLLLLYVFKLNIFAVVIGTTVFAIIICYLNVLALRRALRYRQEVARTFIIPVMASAVMGGVIHFLYSVAFRPLGNKMAALLCVPIGAMVYLALLLLLKGVRERELNSIPKGYLIVRVAKKLHLL